MLFGDGEPDRRPRHPLVSHVAVPAVEPVTVHGIDLWSGPGAVVKALRATCERMGEGTDASSMPSVNA